MMVASAFPIPYGDGLVRTGVADLSFSGRIIPESTRATRYGERGFVEIAKNELTVIASKGPSLLRFVSLDIFFRLNTLSLELAPDG